MDTKLLLDSGTGSVEIGSVALPQTDGRIDDRASASKFEREVVDLDLEQTFRSSYKDMYAYVSSMVSDRELAEDITATVFERAIRWRAQYSQEKGSLRTWLFGIAHNVTIDELRRLSRERNLVANSRQTRGQQMTAEDHIEKHTIKNALKCLDDQELELIGLKFYAGLGNTEVAGIVEISETNVGTMIYRALEKIRRRMLASD